MTLSLAKAWVWAQADIHPIVFGSSLGVLDPSAVCYYAFHFTRRLWRRTGALSPGTFALERYLFRHRLLGGGRFPFWVTSSLTRGLMTSTHNPKFLGPNPKHHLPYSHLHPALRAPRVLGADGPSGGSCKLPISTTRSPSKSVVKPQLRRGSATSNCSKTLRLHGNEIWYQVPRTRSLERSRASSGYISLANGCEQPIR